MAKKLQLLFAPASVLILLSGVFLAFGLFPFGASTLSWCDMNQQVIPLLMDFKDILAGKSGLLFNMQNAGGMSFWAVLLFFIASPFSFLTVFIEKADMYIFMNVLVLIKIALCAFTASLMLKQLSKRLSILQNVMLAASYALCGYGMLYYQNIVWLDMMALFPVLVLGFVRLLREGKSTMFILALAATFVVNFYLSYMVVLFLILAAGIYLLLCVPRKKRGAAALLLGFSAIISAMMTGVVLLPALAQYLQSGRMGDLLQNLSQGGFLARLDTTLPIVLCTPCLIAAVPLFIWQRKRRDSICIFTLFLLMLLPMVFEPINKMWHTGSYQAFPARYGYITALLGVGLMAVVLSALNKAPAHGTHPVASFVGAAACCASVAAAVLMLNGDFRMLSVYTRTLWGNSASLQSQLSFAMVVFLAALLLLLLYKVRTLSRTAVSVFLCVLTAVSGVFSASVYIGSASVPDNGYRHVMVLENQIDDDGLYRVKNHAKYFDANLMGALGYPTLNHYTSLTNRDYMYAVKQLGYSSYWMEVNSNGGTLLSDALMANKYEVTPDWSTGGNTVIFSDGTYAIVQTPVPLNLGLVMNIGDISALEKMPEGARMERQQQIFNSVFGTEKQLITRYEPYAVNGVEMFDREDGRTVMTPTVESAALSYEIVVHGTQTIYFDCFDKLSSQLVEPINGSFDVSVDGELVESEYPRKENNGLLNLGTYTDATIVVTARLRRHVEASSFGIWGMDAAVLSSAVQNVVTADLHDTGAGLDGTVTADGEDAWLFLPVTFDKGFSAVVNGKDTPIYRVFDAFMAVKLSSGENRVTFNYMPRGFLLGAGISIAGVLLFLAFLWLKKRGISVRAALLIKKLEMPAGIALWICMTAVFVLLYLFPVVVYLFGAF